FADIAIATRHLIERTLSSASVAVAFEIRRARNHHLTCLNQRRDQQAGWRVVARCRPVVAASAGGACVDCLTRRFVDDIVAVRGLAGYWYNLVPVIWETIFLGPRLFAGLG